MGSPWDPVLQRLPALALLLFSVCGLFPFTTPQPFPGAKVQVKWSPELEPSGGVAAWLIAVSPVRLSLCDRDPQICQWLLGVPSWQRAKCSHGSKRKASRAQMSVQTAGWGGSCHCLLEHSCWGRGEPCVTATGSTSPTGESQDGEEARGSETQLGRGP